MVEIPWDPSGAPFAVKEAVRPQRAPVRRARIPIDGEARLSLILLPARMAAHASANQVVRGGSVERLVRPRGLRFAAAGSNGGQRAQGVAGVEVLCNRPALLRRGGPRPPHGASRRGMPLLWAGRLRLNLKRAVDQQIWAVDQ